MPSRRIRRREGILPGGTINRGGHWWDDFPGEKICKCGHPEHWHENNDGPCDFRLSSCHCKKFEEK